MTKKKGLGRGLSALLDDPTTDITTRSECRCDRDHVQQVRSAPCPSRTSNRIPSSRARISATKRLAELAQSISELGVIQPVTLRKVGYDRYQLISGERRFRASQLAGSGRSARLRAHRER